MSFRAKPRNLDRERHRFRSFDFAQDDALVEAQDGSGHYHFCLTVHHIHRGGVKRKSYHERRRDEANRANVSVPQAAEKYGEFVVLASRGVVTLHSCARNPRRRRQGGKDAVLLQRETFDLDSMTGRAGGPALPTLTALHAPTAP